MTHRPNLFRKSPIALGVAALLASSAVTVNAADFEFGDVTVTIDSTFTVGTAYRVEDRDLSLIGNSNLDGEEHFSGYIDELRIYKDILLPNELLSLYNSFFAVADAYM